MKHHQYLQKNATRKATNYFHISSNPDLADKPLLPRVPQRLYDVEPRIERVCFSDSIEGALAAITPKDENELYVYMLKDPFMYTINTPTIKEVPDQHTTHEIWILRECEVIPYMKIKILGVYNVIDEKHYNESYCSNYFLYNIMKDKKFSLWKDNIH